MEISKAAFARMAGVSRQAIDDQIKRGHVVCGPKGPDPEHPINQAYLARTIAGTTRSGPKSRSAEEPTAAAAREQPESGRKRKAPLASGEDAAAKAPEAGKEKKLREALVNAGLGAAGLDVDEMIQTVVQKGYWDTMKVKEEVLKKQLDRAREVGSVIDQRIIESEIGAFGQAIVANFVDSPQKQAIQICQMLGVEGKEREVTEFLEKDNARRLEESRRVVQQIKAGVLKSISKNRPGVAV
jgi:hypothetical protein